jgi:hypothetical protein
MAFTRNFDKRISIAPDFLLTAEDSMPMGAFIGGLCCAALFGFMAARDDAIAIRPDAAAHREGR